MSKRKKTRQAKIISDLRRKIAHTDITPPAQVVSSHRHEQFASTTYTTLKKPSLHEYSNTHVLQDLQKTTFVTVSILAVEIILFMLLKNQLLSIPIVGF